MPRPPQTLVYSEETNRLYQEVEDHFIVLGKYEGYVKAIEDHCVAECGDVMVGISVCGNTYAAAGNFTNGLRAELRIRRQFDSWCGRSLCPVRPKYGDTTRDCLRPLGHEGQHSHGGYVWGNEAIMDVRVYVAADQMIYRRVRDGEYEVFMKGARTAALAVQACCRESWVGAFECEPGGRSKFTWLQSHGTTVLPVQREFYQWHAARQRKAEQAGLVPARGQGPLSWFIWDIKTKKLWSWGFGQCFSYVTEIADLVYLDDYVQNYVVAEVGSSRGAATAIAHTSGFSDALEELTPDQLATWGRMLTCWFAPETISVIAASGIESAAPAAKQKAHQEKCGFCPEQAVVAVSETLATCDAHTRAATRLAERLQIGGVSDSSFLREEVLRHVQESDRLLAVEQCQAVGARPAFDRQAPPTKHPPRTVATMKAPPEEIPLVGTTPHYEWP